MPFLTIRAALAVGFLALLVGAFSCGYMESSEDREIRDARVTETARRARDGVDRDSIRGNPVERLREWDRE